MATTIIAQVIFPFNVKIKRRIIRKRTIYEIFYSLINVLPHIKTKTIILLLFILFFICAALYVQLFGLNTSAYKLIDSFFILSNTQLFILKKKCVLVSLKYTC